MRTEQPTDGAPGDEVSRVRAALVPDRHDAPVATWRDIEARAGQGQVAKADAPQAVVPMAAIEARPRDAANDPRPWRKLGWAAALVLGVGLVTLMSPPAPGPEPAMRGVGAGVIQGAQWRVDRPLEAAETLATELRGLQAEVSVTRHGETAVLDIRALPGAVDAVNARLAGLETGLDAQGRLQLVVQPPH